MADIEVLPFCAEALVIKIKQDFEELSAGDIIKLQDSLIQFLLKFGVDTNNADVRTQIVLAIAAFWAHADGSFWHPQACIQWLVD